eukprot:jgi/Bigna1/88532/estExt_fgenesh1_pg.C_330111
MAASPNTSLLKQVEKLATETAESQKSRRILYCPCFERENLYIYKLKSKNKLIDTHRPRLGKTLSYFEVVVCVSSVLSVCGSYSRHFEFYGLEDFRSKEESLLGSLSKEEAKELESALQKEVEARANRAYESGLRKSIIMEKYKRADSDVYTLNPSEMLSPDFLRIVEKARAGKADSALEKSTTIGDRNVYTFPCFRQEFCKRLIKELENINKSGVQKSRPNSMNNYGLLLNERCRTENNSTGLVRFIQPIAKLVDYERGKDTELREHYDDAEITLNVCLGTEDFKGGDLIFFDGVRGFKAKEESSVKKYLRIKHKIGNAVIHLGSGIHRALHITGGRRFGAEIQCTEYGWVVLSVEGQKGTHLHHEQSLPMQLKRRIGSKS